MNPLRLALATVCVVLCASRLHAQQPEDASALKVWLNPGSFSYHFDRDKNLREDNTGFGVELTLTEQHVLSAGSFINSDRMRSRYGAYFWRPLRWNANDIKLYAGIAVGGFDGYPKYRNGNWFPAALPMLAIESGPWGANFFLVPTIANRLNGAVSLQLKLRVW